MNPDKITKLAMYHGWTLRDHQENICLLIFDRGNQQMNVYYSKMTVATILNHPKQGKNSLYRKHVSQAELEKLLKVPRTHTGKGYRTAGERASYLIDPQYATDENIGKIMRGETVEIPADKIKKLEYPEQPVMVPTPKQEPASRLWFFTTIILLGVVVILIAYLLMLII